MSPFADTFALIAWLNERDPYHVRVREYLAAYEGVLISTEWVLMELASKRVHFVDDGLNGPNDIGSLAST